MLMIASLADSLSAAAVLGWAVGWQEILIIVIVVLILFGGRKIPELAKGLGKGLREFKREMQGVKRDFEEAADTEEEYEPPRRKRRRKKRRPEPVEDADEGFETDSEAEEAPAEAKEPADVPEKKPANSQ